MTANSFGSRAALDVAGKQYEIYRLDAAGRICTASRTA